MSKRNPNIRPGWKMTWDQSAAYFRMWSEIVRVRGYKGSAEQMDAHRHAFHAECGLGPVSAKLIDRMKGFDAIKQRFLAITQPANLNAQMHMAEQPKIRLMTAIRGLAGEPYWAKIARDKYGTDDLSGLNEKELIDLRNTLEARKVKPKTTVECPF